MTMLEGEPCLAQRASVERSAEPEEEHRVVGVVATGSRFQRDLAEPVALAPGGRDHAVCAHRTGRPSRLAQSPAVSTSAGVSYEQALAALRPLWEDALERPVTDEDDDFFELGGDSILALSVAGRAARTGLSLPRTAVLRRPTLRLLAEAVVDPRLFALD
jgi:hypothetical protein